MARHIALRWTALLGIGAAAIAGGATYLVYSHEMRTIMDRVAAGSQVVDTAQGRIEFASWGSGPPALVVHGAAGGYDQGRLLAEAFGGDGFRWIAPSRFGYLRTPMPADGSTAAQADAFAALLDTLGIDRAAVVAVSGGVPPALQLAERHPQRIAALVLISSAPYTPFTAAEQELPIPGWAYQLLFSSGFPYWLMQKIAPTSLAAIFDVTPALRARLTPADEAAVAAMVDAFQPVTARTAGLANEAAAIDPDARYALEGIAAPTLVIHARDDGINPFAIGVSTAERIPGAELMPLDTGGHLSLGRRAEVRARVNAFLRAHAGGANR
jgi:2-hydroxy-6-oxonona-2,4-dienedioate hydrolase